MEITNSRQRKTLEKIFAVPVPSSILWTDVESLLKHVGCEIRYGSGSRIGFKKDEKILSVHRPHPQRQTSSGITKEIKIFLKNIGVAP
jgi:hypothetical protein